jgi:hypothetical protein
MPTIKIVISLALAEKRNANVSNNRVLGIALNQLNDEFELIGEDTTKEKVLQVIKSKKYVEEQNWIQLMELGEDTLAELPESKDTILAELNEIIRQL